MMFITTVQAENQLPVKQFRSGPFAITATEDKITGALADFHDLMIYYLWKQIFSVIQTLYDYMID